MKPIIADTNLTAYCGLYCGACGAYLAGRCPGCRENTKATWCRIRSCCAKNACSSCADCGEFPEPSDCAKFNNLVSKLFGLLFRSDRAACIRQVRRIGRAAHAEDMAGKKRHTIRKGERTQ